MSRPRLYLIQGMGQDSKPLRPALRLVLSPITDEEDRAMRRAAYRERQKGVTQLRSRRRESGKLYRRERGWDED